MAAKKLPLTHAERDFMRSSHALTCDVDGNEVLVGLSRDESLFLLRYTLDSSLGRAPLRQEERTRFQWLHEKHERARLADAKPADDPEV